MAIFAMIILGIFWLAILLLVLVSLGLPISLMVKWKGYWRLTMWLPILLIAALIINIIVDINRDPFSHNLFPFEIIFASIYSLIVTGIIALARIAKKQKQKE